MNENDIMMTNDTVNENEDDVAKHYGTPRHSGRYPWGSGKNPQRNRNWLQRADDLVAQGLSKKEVAEALGLSTGDYVAIRKNYTYQLRMEQQADAIKHTRPLRGQVRPP